MVDWTSEGFFKASVYYAMLPKEGHLCNTVSENALFANVWIKILGKQKDSLI